MIDFTAVKFHIPGMFFRRKPVTLASLDARLSVVELALEISREKSCVAPVKHGGPLEAALARLQRAIHRDNTLADRRRA